MTTMAASPALTAYAATRPAVSAAPSDRTHVRTPRLELTRRGRLVVSTVVFLALLVATIAVMFAVGAPAAIASWGDEPQYVSVTVQSGDSLWSYARQYAPSGTDPRDFVLEIQQVNDLPTSQIEAGTQLNIPVHESAQR